MQKSIEEQVEEFIKDNGIVLLAEYTKGDVIGLQSVRLQIENALKERDAIARQEENRDIAQGIQLMKLPYAYKIKSPFPGEGVDFHLKMYGHLPADGCCKYDQYTDEETDIYNKAIDDISEALTPDDKE